MSLSPPGVVPLWIFQRASFSSGPGSKLPDEDVRKVMSDIQMMMPQNRKSAISPELLAEIPGGRLPEDASYLRQFDDYRLGDDDRNVFSLVDKDYLMDQTYNPVLNDRDLIVEDNRFNAADSNSNDFIGDKSSEEGLPLIQKHNSKDYIAEGLVADGSPVARDELKNKKIKLLEFLLKRVDSKKSQSHFHNLIG